VADSELVGIASHDISNLIVISMEIAARFFTGQFYIKENLNK